MRFLLVLTLVMAGCGDHSGVQPDIDASTIDARPDAEHPDAIMPPDAIQADAGCPSGQVECGASCVDTGSDPGNCGACGHDCLGGVCQAGACQPIALQENEFWPQALALDAGNVYWTLQNGAIRTVPKSGGTATTLASVAGGESRLAIDSTYLYALTRGSDSDATGGITRVTLSGGATRPLASAQPHPYDIALNGTNVYWTVPVRRSIPQTYDGAIMVAPRDGSAAPSVFSTGTDVHPLFLAIWPDSGIYMTETIGNVRFVDWWGGYPIRAIQNLLQPGAIVITSAGTFVSTPEAIYRWRSGVQAIVSDSNNSYALAVDDAYVYFSGTDGASDAIKRAPVTGGATSVLAHTYFAAQAIAVDAQAVYWLEYNGSRLWKLAK